MSLNETVLALNSTQESLALKSWQVGDILLYLIYILLAFAYFGTVIPSIVGLIPIYFSKACILVIFMIDGIAKLFPLVFVPTSEAYIWTSKNWGANCFRRILIEILINCIYILTQQLPAVNWISNLLPLGLSLYNLTSISTQ